MKTLEERVKEIERHLGFDSCVPWRITIEDGLSAYSYVFSVPNGENYSIDSIMRKIGKVLDPDIEIFPKGEYVEITKRR